MLDTLKRKQERVIDDPKFVKMLFNDVRFSVLWLVVRVWLGIQWLQAGWHKTYEEPWVTGSALQGYWTRAVEIPETGRPAIAFDWYRNFLQFLLDNEAYTWFGQVIAWGEVLVGIGLIVGAFVGIAAFFGALMNFNFMLAGSASTNPVLFILALGLIFAWKIAGFIGADYYLLNWIGTPWKRGEYIRDMELEPDYAR